MKGNYFLIILTEKRSIYGKRQAKNTNHVVKSSSIPHQSMSGRKNSGNTARSSGTSCSNVDSGVASQDEDEIEGNFTRTEPSIMNSIDAQLSEDNEVKSKLDSIYERKRYKFLDHGHISLNHYAILNLVLSKLQIIYVVYNLGNSQNSIR